MRILFTGGGTGGHVFPIVAIARQFKTFYNQEKPLEMFFLGAGGFSKDLLENEGIKSSIILAGKLRRYFSLKTILDLIQMPLGFIQAFWFLYIWMPEVIFSKGGYGSLPVVLIGWLFRIPIMVHDSDAVPGLANRIAAKFATRIAVSFQEAEKYFPKDKTALIGNPIRTDLVQICVSENQEDKAQARGIFQIVGQKPVIFILGGSQGSQSINEMVLEVLPQLLEKYELIHQVGLKNYQDIQKRLKSIPGGYHLYPSLEESQMAGAYLISDLIISRAGAASVFEITACGKPSILIPLPNSASDHQRENAFSCARAGAASVLEQANLTSNLFLNEINKIIGDNELSQKMAANAKSFSKVQAAQTLAETLVEMGE